MQAEASPWTWTAPLPPHCHPSSAFLALLSAGLGSCVPTAAALLSSTLGILSIGSWLFAQLPQILRNHELGSASGLSVYFLIEWTLGDSTNLLGALFTRQATWQVVVAAYYVLVDVVLIGQYVWYDHLKPKREQRSSSIHRDRAPARGPNRDPEDRRVEHSTAAAAAIVGKARGPAREKGGLLAPDAPETVAISPPPPPSSSSSSSSSFDGRRALRPPNGDRAVRPVAAPPRSISPLVSPRSLLALSLLCALAHAHPHALASSGPTSPNGHGHGLSHGATTNAHARRGIEQAGRILAWCSTGLYLGSRFPQLYQNHVRRSTSGLSLKLFVAAFFGNLFYSSSLLANPCAWSDLGPFGAGGWVGAEGSQRVEWIARAAPFWLGAAGVLALDAAIGLQFVLYPDVTQEEEEEEEVVVEQAVEAVEVELGGEVEEVTREELGSSRLPLPHWTRVTGWMRGWVPGPRLVLRRKEEEEEEEEEEESAMTEMTTTTAERERLRCDRAADGRGSYGAV
ncbi:MAG: hypothetical protein M1826_000178 [Phylliscum demangeonii]|nr:MAG: hypothetical protein M1826_000178 [Phylliscum demangeonii]